MADQGAEGFFSPLLRSRRFLAVKPFLRGRVLDFGCGTGGLAQYVPASRYLGVDIDDQSLQLARSKFPYHHYCKGWPDILATFDTIVLAAVIEHMPHPVEILSKLRKHLADTHEARLIITTPHPSLDWVHRAGAYLGLFSKHASDEHHQLLDYPKLKGIGHLAWLSMILY
ncbi:Methyltransferase domain-containing protein [Desulfacinum infernum DSM 9756]|uniref:Methyltransferase domain-containing protein n=1 Tax=Desulfacinum infernum DSM 9756 TaxID=1121391 RepID=A0A1M4SX49_9BACT|nr:Methyltransferase domain-containing protein [Desulfacinum infernum DSM 9756]